MRHSLRLAARDGSLRYLPGRSNVLTCEGDAVIGGGVEALQRRGGGACAAVASARLRGRAHRRRRCHSEEGPEPAESMLEVGVELLGDEQQQLR